MVPPQLHPPASLRHRLTSALIYDAVFKSQPRRFIVTFTQAIADGENPTVEASLRFGRGDAFKTANRCDLIKLTLER